jgi:uncharacterized protein
MNETIPPVQPQSQPDHLWVVLCHLSALAMFVVPIGGNLLGPLIIWLIKKQEYPSVDLHGKESLNFQLSMTIYMLIAGLLMFVVIGIVLLPLIVIANVVLIIIAAVKASNRELYRYPLTIKFID